MSAAPRRDPGVGGGGVDHAPLRGDAELAAFGGSGVQLALLEHLEQAGGVEVGDLDGLSAASVSNMCP
ncbi:hypothetical protein [Nocardioides ungokensis]|uniref:hypothetical protein n=1 Tax=Nocardioides ungokensis TaxID=1643322 RepID=UPI0015DEECDF|nr:hypothetical protein [Nocardioides ungokensis]